jgi:hypothetical protein
MKCEGTWRWVAGKYEDRYENNKPFNHESTYGGNQIDGMYLCREASKILNITVD